MPVSSTCESPVCLMLCTHQFRAACAPGAEPHQISLSPASTDFRFYLNRSVMYRKERQQEDSKNPGKLNPTHLLEQKGFEKSLGAPAEKV